MNTILNKIEKIICTVTAAFNAILLGIMITIMAAQVICRYALPSVTLWWAEDILILGILWITAVGSSAAWLKGTNLVMDVISSKVSDRFLNRLEIVIDIAGIVIGIAVARAGVIAYYNNKGFVQSGLRFDESFRYVPIILFGVSISFAAVLTLLKMFSARKQKSMGEVKA